MWKQWDAITAVTGWKEWRAIDEDELRPRGIDGGLVVKVVVHPCASCLLFQGPMSKRLLCWLAE